MYFWLRASLLNHIGGSLGVLWTALEPDDGFPVSTAPSRDRYGKDLLCHVCLDEMNHKLNCC